MERTPAELFLKRQPRIRLALLKPNTSAVVLKHQRQQKKGHDTPFQKLISFTVGQKVNVLSFRHPHRAWVPGVFLHKHGPRTYQVKVRDRSVKVHVDHLLSSNAQDIIDPIDTRMADDFAPDAGNEAHASVPQPHIPMDRRTVPGSERRYSIRQRKAPNRLDL